MEGYGKMGRIITVTGHDFPGSDEPTVTVTMDHDTAELLRLALANSQYVGMGQFRLAMILQRVSRALWESLHAVTTYGAPHDDRKVR